MCWPARPWQAVHRHVRAHTDTQDRSSPRPEHQHQDGLHGRLSWFWYFLFGSGVIVGVGGAISQIPHFPVYSLSRADPQPRKHVFLGGTSVPLQSQHRRGKEATPTVEMCQFCTTAQSRLLPTALSCHWASQKYIAAYFRPVRCRQALNPYPAAPSFCTERYSVTLIFCGSSGSSSSVLHSPELHTLPGN